MSPVIGDRGVETGIFLGIRRLAKVDPVVGCAEELDTVAVGSFKDRLIKFPDVRV